jgi:nicotinamide-nucleotide amidase
VIDEDLRSTAAALLDLCRAKSLKLTAAESCTGGLLMAALTDIPGSSDVVERGFVTYSNAAKETMLDVPADVIASHGAVSRQTVEAMVKGALAHSPAQLAAAITGIAGPAGGTPDKPVGLVHVAAMCRGGPFVHREERFGDIGRSAIRRASVLSAFALLSDLAGQ